MVYWHIHFLLDFKQSNIIRISKGLRDKLWVSQLLNILLPLRNPHVYYNVQNCTPVHPILSQPNLARSLTLCFLKSNLLLSYFLVLNLTL